MTNPVVFFGSGPVAAESLRLLLKHQQVEAIITKPSTKQEMQSVAQDIAVYTTNTKQELDELIEANNFSGKLGVLIDFGIIVSQKVIDSFEKGIINSHFSLLPEWRGADPITFSILSGQKKTGVSIMAIDTGMDTGKLLAQKSLPIEDSETTPSLTQKLIVLSNQLLEAQIPRYLQGEATLRAQPHQDRATYSRKLTKEDGVLDFSKPAQVLEREIRAFLEWPKSRTIIAERDVVVLSAQVDTAKRGPVGQVFKTAEKTIGMYCAEGALIITELKPAGKQAMTSEGFLAGYGKDIPLE